VAYGFDDEPSWLGVELHLVGEFGFLEQRLWNPDATRVADAHDARLRCHGDYIVITPFAERNPVLG